MKKFSRAVSLVFIVCLFITIIVFRESIWGELLELQRYFNSRVFSLIRFFKGNFSGQNAIVLFSLSALYGVIHAVGPGHGKTVLGTYLISRDARYKQAFLSALIAAFTHVGMAVALSFLLKFVFTSMNTFGRRELLINFQQFSGAVIVTIGVLVMVFAIIGQKIKFNNKIFRTPAIGVLAGIVPCPLSLSIMLTCISYSIVTIGLLAVFGMVSGIFLFLLGFSFFVVATRDNITKTISGETEKKTPRWIFGVQGILYILFGALMIG